MHHRMPWDRHPDISPFDAIGRHLVENNMDVVRKIVVPRTCAACAESCKPRCFHVSPDLTPFDNREESWRVAENVGSRLVSIYNAGRWR